MIWFDVEEVESIKDAEGHGSGVMKWEWLEVSGVAGHREDQTQHG